MNQLDGIKQFTTVVADSGVIESIQFWRGNTEKYSRSRLH